MKEWVNVSSLAFVDEQLLAVDARINAVRVFVLRERTQPAAMPLSFQQWPYTQQQHIRSLDSVGGSCSYFQCQCLRSCSLLRFFILVFSSASVSLHYSAYWFICISACLLRDVSVSECALRDFFIRPSSSSGRSVSSFHHFERRSSGPSSCCWRKQRAYLRRASTELCECWSLASSSAVHRGQSDEHTLTIFPFNVCARKQKQAFKDKDRTRRLLQCDKVERKQIKREIRVGARACLYVYVCERVCVCIRWSNAIWNRRRKRRQRI